MGGLLRCYTHTAEPRLTWWRSFARPETPRVRCYSLYFKSIIGGVKRSHAGLVLAWKAAKNLGSASHSKPPFPAVLSFRSILTYGSVPEDGDFSWFRLRHVSLWLSHLVLGVYRNLLPEWHPNSRGAENGHAACRWQWESLGFAVFMWILFLRESLKKM